MLVSDQKAVAPFHGMRSSPHAGAGGRQHCIRPRASAEERAFGSNTDSRGSRRRPRGVECVLRESRRMLASWCSGKRSRYRRCSSGNASATLTRPNTPRSNQRVLRHSTAIRRCSSEARQASSPRVAPSFGSREQLHARDDGGSRARPASPPAPNGCHGHARRLSACPRRGNRGNRTCARLRLPRMRPRIPVNSLVRAQVRPARIFALGSSMRRIAASAAASRCAPAPRAHAIRAGSRRRRCRGRGQPARRCGRTATVHSAIGTARGRVPRIETSVAPRRAAAFGWSARGFRQLRRTNERYRRLRAVLGQPATLAVGGDVVVRHSLAPLASVLHARAMARITPPWPRPRPCRSAPGSPSSSAPCVPVARTGVAGRGSDLPVLRHNACASAVHRHHGPAIAACSAGSAAGVRCRRPMASNAAIRCASPTPRASRCGTRGHWFATMAGRTHCRVAPAACPCACAARCMPASTEWRPGMVASTAWSKCRVGGLERLANGGSGMATRSVDWRCAWWRGGLRSKMRATGW